MSANVEAMIREGISAVKAGRKDEGRALLTKAVELDAYNEEGWLWLSGVVDSPDDQRTCLENVLAINPGNDKARKGLDYLTKKPEAVSQSAVPPAPAPEPAVSASEPPAVVPGPSSVTSVEWDFGAPETSSASTERPVKEPTAQDYDDWVSGLNLSTVTDDPAAIAAAAASSPFVGFDDEFFNDDMPAAAAPAPATPALNPFAEDTMAARPVPASPTIAYTAPPPLDVEPIAAVAAGAAAAGRMSPGRTDSVRNAPIPALVGLVDEDEYELTGEMFPSIPKAITPTRLPGTKERPPLLYRLTAVVLLVANIVVAVLLAMKLTGRA